MALITASEARGDLRGLTGTAEDATINTLITRVDGLFASYCGYMAKDGTSGATMEDVTYTEYLDGPTRSREIRLSVYPVVSVTSIHDDADLGYNSDDLVAASDYTLYGNEGLVILNENASHAWTKGRRNIKVVYVAGWATIPDALKHAACLQTAHLYQHRDTIGKTDLRVSTASATVSALSLLPEVRAALAPFRLTNHWVL